MDLITSKPIAKVVAAYATAVLIPVAIGVLEAFGTGEVSWKELGILAVTNLAVATAAYLKRFTPEDLEQIDASRVPAELGGSE